MKVLDCYCLKKAARWFRPGDPEYLKKLLRDKNNCISIITTLCQFKRVMKTR